MTYLRSYKVPNGDEIWNIKVFECDGCNKKIDESNPRTEDEEKDIHFCTDCSFRLKKINGKEYAQLNGVHLSGYEAFIDINNDILIDKLRPKNFVSVNKKRSKLDKKKRFSILERDKFKCQYCGATSHQTTLEVDHIIPLSRGGSDDANNLITSCRDCNVGKLDFILKKDTSNVGK